jgi:DNA mismatch repair protein MSH5
LKHLLARGSDCPKVIATTHFHELFSPGSGALDPLSQRLPITFVHMEIMFATRDGEIITDAASSTTVTKAENITYLYRLVASLGVFYSSYRGIHLQGRKWALTRIACGTLRAAISAFPLTSFSAHNTSRTSHYDMLYRKHLDDDPLPLILAFVAICRELLSINELPRLLDEAISEGEQLDMDLASAVCQRFLEWDLETQEASLGEVREKTSTGTGPGCGLR